MQTAVKCATRINTVVIGDDTDLLVLLIYLAEQGSHDIYFKPEPKKNTKKQRIWNIQAVKANLGHELCNSILFIHAILGCDTTSHIFGIGKAASIKKFTSSQYFRDQAKVFNDIPGSKDDIITVGIRAIACLYNGKPEDNLDSLRHKKFCEKVATKVSHVLPQTIPPTSSAAKFHSLRVYFQIRQWKGMMDNMKPEDWGWRNSDGSLVPVMTDLLPAPEDLLRVISCNCHTDCSSFRCTCRKHDLECTAACGQCRGSGCSNVAETEIDQDDNL